MRARAFGVAALIGIAALVPTGARAAVTVVQVRSNFYSPQEIHVAVGDTVSWTAVDPGHTVTAEDLRFDYYPNRTLNQGETVSFTFTTDNETLYYRCRIHGPAMFGVIVVGNGSPQPPPPPPAPREIRQVPSQYASLAAALNGAPEDSEIDLAPGVYHEGVTVATKGITIQGTGASPGDVILEGDARTPTGVRVTGPAITISNVTFRRYEQTGIVLDGATAYTISSVDLVANGVYGVRATGARTGVISDTSVSGSATAGISFSECDPCDAIVQRARINGNGTGLAGLDASGLVVRDSAFDGNGAGIVLRSVAGGTEYPQSGAHILGNTIARSDARVARAPSDRFDLRTGAAVWIDGGSSDLVEDNTISGARTGVLITALSGPSQGDRVTGNTISGASQAAIAWDGIGAGVCFSGNAGPGGADPVTSPPMAQTVFACEGGLPVGVPFPPVDADLLAHGLVG